MAKYIEKFILPTEDDEIKLVRKRMVHNGGSTLGWIDNTYPCGIFTAKKLTELDFKNITIWRNWKIIKKFVKTKNNLFLNLIDCY